MSATAAEWQAAMGLDMERDLEVMWINGTVVLRQGWGVVIQEMQSGDQKVLGLGSGPQYKTKVFIPWEAIGALQQEEEA